MAYENIPVEFNKERHRFEMKIDDKYAFINYRQYGDVVDLVHTEVAEALEGKGVAATLVEETLQYAAAHQLKIIPSCSYVQHYLQKHPEWNRLVAEQ